MLSTPSNTVSYSSWYDCLNIQSNPYDKDGALPVPVASNQLTMLYPDDYED
jgi:hypothetical protein